MKQFQDLVNLDQLPLGRQQNGLGKITSSDEKLSDLV
jgi:hypothetical protein